MSKLATQSYKGFSKRLNSLLDDAGYPPLDYGRARFLAEAFGVSKSGARKWIREDTLPRLQTLHKIIQTLYKKTKLNSLSNTNKAIAWLQYGDTIENSVVDDFMLQADHILLSGVYLNVHKCARRLGLDLEELPKRSLDRIYNTVIEQTLKQDTAEPDQKLIVSMLELVKSK